MVCPNCNKKVDTLLGSDQCFDCDMKDQERVMKLMLSVLVVIYILCAILASILFL